MGKILSTKRPTTLQIVSTTDYGEDNTTLFYLHGSLVRSALDNDVSIVNKSAHKSYITLIGTIHHQELPLSHSEKSLVDSLYMGAKKSSL